MFLGKLFRGALQETPTYKLEDDKRYTSMPLYLNTSGITPSRPCLEFAPRSESFAIEPSVQVCSISSLSGLALRASSVRKSAPRVGEVGMRHTSIPPYLHTSITTPHPAFGHLLPQGAKGKSLVWIALGFVIAIQILYFPVECS